MKAHEEEDMDEGGSPGAADEIEGGGAFDNTQQMEDEGSPDRDN
jgi:hypothetical protein